MCQDKTYSGNFISTCSWGFVFRNSTRSSPACSIILTCKSFCAVHLSCSPVVASAIKRVKYGLLSSPSVRERLYRAKPAGITPIVP